MFENADLILLGLGGGSFLHIVQKTLDSASLASSTHEIDRCFYLLNVLVSVPLISMEGQVEIFE